MWADFAYVQKAEVTQEELRGVLEAIGGEPCLAEHMAFDIAGDGFRVPVWLVRFVVVMQVIGPQTFECHMRPPRLCQLPNSVHRSVRWSNPLMIGTHRSHSYSRVLMSRSVTAMDPCFLRWSH